MANMMIRACLTVLGLQNHKIYSGIVFELVLRLMRSLERHLKKRIYKQSTWVLSNIINLAQLSIWEGNDQEKPRSSSFRF
jgi:hypothetical protein